MFEQPSDILADDVLKERFEVTKRLGEGTYGTVYDALDKVKQTRVAIKSVKFHGREKEGIPPTTIREIAILKELDHKNIVRLNDVVYHVTNSGSQKLYLVF